MNTTRILPIVVGCACLAGCASSNHSARTQSTTKVAPYATQQNQAFRQTSYNTSGAPVNLNNGLAFFIAVEPGDAEEAWARAAVDQPSSVNDKFQWLEVLGAGEWDFSPRQKLQINLPLYLEPSSNMIVSRQRDDYYLLVRNTSGSVVNAQTVPGFGVVNAGAIETIGRNNQTNASITVQLTPGAQQALEQLTQANIGKALVVAVDGKIIHSERISQPIYGAAKFGKLFNLQQTEQLAASLVDSPTSTFANVPVDDN